MSDTTNEPASDLLRRAADTIAEFAGGTTPGSWNGHLSTEGPGYGEVSGGPWENGYRMGSVMRWCEETVIEYGGEPTLADLRWLCLMSPHIAGPLVGWLRGLADALDRLAAEPVAAAVAFARALLDEERPAAVVAVVTTHQDDAMLERAR